MHAVPAKNPDPAPATPAYDLPVWFKSMFHAFLLTLALTGVAARPPPKRCLTSLFGAQPSEAIYATDGLQVSDLGRWNDKGPS